MFVAPPHSLKVVAEGSLKSQGVDSDFTDTLGLNEDSVEKYRNKNGK